MSASRYPEEGSGDADVDRAFREIVAGLRGSGEPGADEPGSSARQQEPPPRRPDASAGPRFSTEPTDVNPALPQRPVPHLGARTPEGMATDHRSYEPPEEDDHFVPPDPPPLPAGDLHFWAILVGLVVGPVLVVLSAVVPVLDRPWGAVGVGVSIAGFVLLVLRQPRRRGPDDGSHGAQV